MTGNEKSDAKKPAHREQVQYLADRLAITLMLLRREVDLNIATLPSMAGMRESIRGDVDYEKMLNVVRELLRREV